MPISRLNFNIAQNQKANSGADIQSDSEGNLSVRNGSIVQSEIRVDRVHAYLDLALYEQDVYENEGANTNAGQSLFLIYRHGRHILCGKPRTRPEPFSLQPVCDFTISPTSGISVGDTVTFTDSSTYDGLNTIKWVWNWGDGTESSVKFSSAAVTHAFSLVGRYKVSLTIVDAQGRGSKKSKYVVVS